ncbi:MAG: ATP-binding cassette domain-containing protein [Xanthobacteraceae bacterium]|nr:ATP-binding cassette domain-containing protein [Xanthobacteraceae bacterium]
MAAALASRRTVLACLSAAALVGAAMTGALIGDAYVTMLLAQSFTYAIAAISLDLVWGYAGIPELGHSLWFGIGALCVGSMTTSVSETGGVLAAGADATTYILAAAVGVVLAAAMAAIVGWYAFSRGATHFYIAVVGLALAAAAQPAYSQFPRYTGGEGGLFGFAYEGFSNAEWYYVSAAVLLCVTAFLIVLVRSDFGLLLRAVRDNERRVRYLGFNVERIKIAIYSLGAALAGLAGALYAAMEGAVSAPLFGTLFATEMMVWVAVGGRGTILGPAIGTIALGLGGSKLSAAFPLEWSLFLGLALVLIVVFFQAGVLPPIARGLARAVLGSGHKAEQNRSLVAGRETAVPARDASASAAIEISGLFFAYGGLRVLRGVNLEILKGELLCIVGPNGAGKSTLIEVLTDGARNFAGQVAFLLGDRVEHQGRQQDVIARSGVVRKFQVPSLFPSMTVAEHILLATSNGRWPSVWRRTHAIGVPPVVEAICAASGLTGRLEEVAADLSHGVAQGLEMAMAVATRPRIVFMDEPTAGLSAVERAVVGDLLRVLAKSGITVVLVEHDLDFVERIADRVAVLHEGRVLEVGAPSQIAQSDVVRGAYLGSFELEKGDH